MNWIEQYSGLIIALIGIILTGINLFFVYKLRAKELTNSLYVKQLDKYLEMISALNIFNQEITSLLSKEEPLNRDIVEKWNEINRQYEKYMLIFPDPVLRKILIYLSTIGLCYPLIQL